MQEGKSSKSNENKQLYNNNSKLPPPHFPRSVSLNSYLLSSHYISTVYNTAVEYQNQKKTSNILLGG